MIFRNINGEVVKINKYDYSNDMIFYEKIMNLQKEFSKYKNNTTIEVKPKPFFLKKILTEADVRFKNNSKQLNKISEFINVKLDF